MPPRLNGLGVTSEQKALLKENMNEIAKQKERVIYNMKEVDEVLENLTEDEEEIKLKPMKDQEIWMVKRFIKQSIKKDKKVPEFDWSYYKLGRMLGRGSFGKINIGLHKLTFKLVAVKSIKREIAEDNRFKYKIYNEAHILKGLCHKNVIRMY